MQICRLCNQTRKLVKAHIFPKWVFVYLYPDNKISDKALIIVGDIKDKKSRIGLYDSDILCSNCDQFLGIYDNYGKSILINKKFGLLGTVGYLLENVDFQKLKIFLLSVLWRSSISKKEELKIINLGPYEEIIRTLLEKVKLNQSVADELDTFPILMTKFGDGNYSRVVDKNIQLPLPHRIDHINFNVLYFPRGLKIYIRTDKKPLPLELVKFTLKEPTIIIPKIEDFQDSNEFKFMVKAVNKNKTRK